MFLNISKFFELLCRSGPGSRNFSKVTKSSFSFYEPKFHQNYPKCCCERELRLYWLFREKIFFKYFQIFLTFLQVRGHEIFQK